MAIDANGRRGRRAAGTKRTRDRQHLLSDLGSRLRRAREDQNIGLRELARRLGVSPALISQIETGKSEPSISMLFSIVSELNLPVNEIVFDSFETARQARHEPVSGAGADEDEPSGSQVRLSGEPLRSPVQPPETRRSILLDSGVGWDRLTAQADHDVDFLYLRYPPGSESTAPNSLMRHNGREYGYIVRGQLTVTLGFDEYVISPGYTISFDCTIPHRLSNQGSEPVEAVWTVIGRRHQQAPEDSRDSAI